MQQFLAGTALYCAGDADAPKLAPSVAQTCFASGPTRSSERQMMGPSPTITLGEPEIPVPKRADVLRDLRKGARVRPVPPRPKK
jgi:hypothetical protein